MVKLIGGIAYGYKQTYELEKSNSKMLEDITLKVGKHEVEIKVVQGGKK